MFLPICFLMKTFIFIELQYSDISLYSYVTVYYQSGIIVTGEDYSADQCWGWWWRRWRHFSSPTPTRLSTTSTSVSCSISCWLPSIRLCVPTACSLCRSVYTTLKNVTLCFIFHVFLCVDHLSLPPELTSDKMTENLSAELRNILQNT